MSELNVPKRIVPVAAIPLLGSGKTDYPAVHALVEGIVAARRAGRAMSRGVAVLLGAQFLTAFADNAHPVHGDRDADRSAARRWYVPALQSSFLVAFVMLAPWVGCSPTGGSKPHVLLLGNVLKAAGAASCSPASSRWRPTRWSAPGAAVYGPAKYGILPELVGKDRLVRANGWIEGSTIVAIVLGHRRRLARRGSLGAARAHGRHGVLPRVRRGDVRLAAARAGASRRRGGLAPVRRPHEHVVRRPRRRASRCSAIRCSGRRRPCCACCSSPGRPSCLLTQSASDVADLTLFLALGIVAGALIVPRLIPIAHLRRARLAAYAMGVRSSLFSLAERAWPARAVLVAIGVCGGMFLVPINAALQDIGHRTIGSGRAVALQSFFENSAMLTGVGIYTASVGLGASPSPRSSSSACSC